MKTKVPLLSFSQQARPESNRVSDPWLFGFPDFLEVLGGVPFF